MKTKENLKRNKGITLVALIVTIIVLLILAGLAIAELKKSNLINGTKNAKQKWNNVTRDEEDMLNYYSNGIDLSQTTRDETITLTKEEYDMFKSQFSTNVNKPKVSINKPNTWEVGTEYDFRRWGLWTKVYWDI